MKKISPIIKGKTVSHRSVIGNIALSLDRRVNGPGGE